MSFVFLHAFFVLISYFDYTKGVNITLWLDGISDRKCVIKTGSVLH